MRGMSIATGEAIDGSAHIKQSIHDILSTPIGSRVMLREYGSRLPDLVDNPINELMQVELYAATAEALSKWEPRFKLRAVWISSRSQSGRITLGLEGVIVDSGTVVRLEGITL